MTDGDKTTLIMWKLCFVVMNFLAMSGALYKMSLMGLLPTTPSDWVSFLAVPTVRSRRPAPPFAATALTRSTLRAQPVQFSAAGF